MKKIISFLKDSNHWKHIIGGCLVAIPTFNWIYAIYTAFIVGFCIEFKDKLWGGKFDFIDWTCTTFGGILISLCYVWL